MTTSTKSSQLSVIYSIYMSKIQPGHFVCFFVCLQFSDQRGREVIHPNVKPHDFSDSCDYHSYTLPKKKNTGFNKKDNMCFVLLHKCIYCWKIFNRDMLSITGLMRKTSLLTVELFRIVPLSHLLFSDVRVQNKFLLSLPKLT